MRFLINRRKLKAAASSMHQFCPAVRSIFAAEVDDEVIESATLFLYVTTARAVFGRRFAQRMTRKLRDQLKYGSPSRIGRRLRRIRRKAWIFRRRCDDTLVAGSVDADFQHHVRCHIRALLSEAGLDDDVTNIGKRFAPFEETVRRIKSHLQGIQQQNHFILK